MTKYLVTFTLTVLRLLLWTPDKIFDIFLTSWNVWCLASGQSQRRKSFSSYAVVTKYLVTLTLTVLRVLLWTPDKIFDIFLTSWNVWCLASGLSQWRKSCNKAAKWQVDQLRGWEGVLSKRHGGLSGEGEAQRRKALHFLNQRYHFCEAYAGDEMQLLATCTLTLFKHSCTVIQSYKRWVKKQNWSRCSDGWFKYSLGCLLKSK